MSDDLGLYINIRANGAQKADADMGKVSRTAGKMEQEAKKAEKGMSALGGSLEKSAGSANRTATAFGSMSNILGTIGVVALGKSILSTADSMTSLRSQVRFVTKDIAELNAVQAQLMQISNRTYNTIEATTSLYTRTARALQDTGRSQKEFLVFTEAINNAMRVGGRGAQEQASALLQLSQALGSGVLQGDEFRSIAENAPIILDIVAEYMGKTRGEIRKLSSEGVITSELLFNAISSSSEALKKQASTMDVTVGQALISLKNNFNGSVESINNMLGVTNSLASGISFLADNISVLLIPATGLLTVGLVKGFTLARTAVLAFNTALMANPVTLVIAGIAMGATAIYSLTRETEQSTNAFHEMTDSIDSVIDKFKELGSVQRKATIEEYKRNQIGALQEVERTVDSLVAKMTNIAVANRGTEGRYLRDTFLQGAEKAIRDAIDSGEDLLDVVDRFAKFEGIDSVLSEVLIDDIRNLDTAKTSLDNYNESLRRLAIEQGTFVGPLQLSIKTEDNSEFLAMQKKITDQVIKRNLIGIEGQVLYEREYGSLKNITEERFKELQLMGQSADIQAKMISQQQTMASQTQSINDRLAKVGMSALNAEIFDLKKIFPEGKELDENIAKLKKIYGAQASFSMGIDIGDAFKDRLVGMSETLSTLQALNKEMGEFGKPSIYNAVSELTLEFQNQSSALYGLSEAQKTVLMNQAKQIDSQRQLNEIMSLGIDSKTSIDDMRFEVETMGLASKEMEKLKFFRDLDTKAKELAIGMSKENIEVLNEEIKKIKELYNLYSKEQKDADDDILAGMRSGVSKFLEEAGTAREAFEDATKGALNSMADGFAEFVTTGKGSFKDMANSIINDIIRIMARWSMAQALGGIAGGIMSGFSGGGRVPEFSSGGYTGNGGKYEPKGVVHGGEYVLRKEVVPKIGLDNLDRMNKGYATGGFVGQRPSSGSSPVTVNVINNSNSEVSVEERDDGNGGKEIQIMINQVLGAVSESIMSNGTVGKAISGRFNVANNIR